MPTCTRCVDFSQPDRLPFTGIKKGKRRANFLLLPHFPTLVQVIPGRFFAMRGPKQLSGGRLYMDRANGSRDFSPEHYTEILVQLGIRVVLRLTDSEYDEQVCLVRV